MSRERPAGNLADRVERAALVLIGAVTLGPALPAAVFSLLAGLARFVPDTASSRPAEPFLPTVVDVLRTAYLDGGGLVAALGGLLIAGAILLRLRLSPALALAAIAAIALAVGWFSLEHRPRRDGLPLDAAFALIALLSARVLIGLGRRLAVLPPEGIADDPGHAGDFARRRAQDRLPPQ